MNRDPKPAAKREEPIAIIKQGNGETQQECCGCPACTCGCNGISARDSR